MICLNRYVQISYNNYRFPVLICFVGTFNPIQTRDRRVAGVTCMFSGGVGQVEATSPVVGPTHELDSDLVAS